MAMHQSNRDYESILYVVVPVLFFVFLILGYVLSETFNSLWFKPWLLSICVFYWTLFTPKAVPILMVLVIGLLEDGLAGTPFGLNALGLLLMHYLSVGQRHSLIYSPFPVVFTGFMLNLFVVMCVMTGIMWFIGLPVSLWILLWWVGTWILFYPMAKLFEVLRFKMMKD